MTLYSFIGYINLLGFIWAFINILKLTFQYERPTYFDEYFYWSFVVSVFGALTQFYTAYYEGGRPEWFLKSFGLVSWIKILVFCYQIKKLSRKIYISKKDEDFYGSIYKHHH